MDILLALLILAIIPLIYVQRKKCLREGRPFFRAGSKAKIHKPIKTSLPQRSQQKYRQRSNNTPPISRARRKFTANKASPKTHKGTPNSPEANQDKASQHLIRKLKSLIRSEATTQRLIRSTKTKNPSKSLDWCIEKAISDVQRDRK